MANARRRAVAEVDARWDEGLIGAIDGGNLVFTTTDPFVQVPPYNVIRVYRNGQRLRLGGGNDYTVSESGGPGSGYDTVTLIGPAPITGERISADYVVQV